MDFDPAPTYSPIGPDSGSGPGSGFDAEPISDLPCERCGRSPASLQSYMWVLSFLVLTRHRRYAANLCRSCATRTGLADQAKSALLGWWGIPWGLMTFQALWINSRSLARWSTLSRPVAALTLLAGLAIPAAVGYAVYGASAGEREARRTGDWVDSAVVRWIEEGDEHLEAGRYDEAFKAYSAAYEKAPRSSVVNGAMSQTLIEMGRLEAALPYAARAAELDPGTLARVAMHGYLVAKLEGADAAAEPAAVLRAATPATALDAVWMADFFETVGEPEQQLRAARAGLALESDAPWLTARELSALVELGRLEEAAPVAASFDEEALAVPFVAYTRDLYRMRVDSDAELPRLESRWLDPGYSEAGMAGFAREAERAGRLAETRAALRRWLFDPATPGDAWGAARPWFEDTWPQELDRYLETRPEPVPALLRLRLYDRFDDADAIRRLAGRVATHDHPLAEYVDLYRYAGEAEGESEARQIERLEAHLEAAPDHVLCRIFLAGLLIRATPERAAVQLQVLQEATREDPELATALAIYRTELELVRGRPDEALSTIREVDRDEPGRYASTARIDFAAAEAAFHAGDRELLERRLGQLIGGDDAGSHGSALLIRWSHELALGRPITYRKDVDALLGRNDEALRADPSTTVQSILIAEGRVDRRREAFISPERRATLELVEAFRAADGSSAPDLAPFERIAGAGAGPAYAPELVRTAISRRAAAGR